MQENIVLPDSNSLGLELLPSKIKKAGLAPGLVNFLADFVQLVTITERSRDRTNHALTR